MIVSVIGVGYLGAVHAAAMAELGHDVIGLDVDADRVAAMQAGRAPFHEPGFVEILRRGLAAGRLRFTTDYAEIAHADVHFLGLGTPQRADGFGADLRSLEAAVASLAAVLPARGGAPTLVVGKSTVPAGTARRLRAQLTASRVSRRELARLGLVAGSAWFAQGTSLRAALAAEGLHAEPLIPGQG